MNVLQAQCAEHPATSAVEVCSRCGRFLCEGCLELVGEAPFCGPCARKGPRFERTGLDTAALALALLGLVLWPLGIVVVLLTLQRVRARGSQWARVAAYLGVLEALGCVAAGLDWLLRHRA